MGLDIAFTGVSELKAGFAEIERRLVSETLAAEAEGARLIETQAKDRAPVKSGRLRDSIVSQVEGTIALVGPTAVYGRRVELGFHGVDSLGRHYDQAGQPYLRPAEAEAAAGPLLGIFAKHWRSALGGT